MAYLGLVHSQHSSGASTKFGSITKTGNGHVRKVLKNAAHPCRHPARESGVLIDRLEGVPRDVEILRGRPKFGLVPGS
jgi:transposase